MIKSGLCLERLPFQCLNHVLQYMLCHVYMHVKHLVELCTYIIPNISNSGHTQRNPSFESCNSMFLTCLYFLELLGEHRISLTHTVKEWQEVCECNWTSSAMKTTSMILYIIIRIVFCYYWYDVSENIVHIIT